MTATGLPLRVEGRMPALDGATGWLNSGPLTTDGLRGRVVLVQFWTYTCINWLRTLPYVRAWAEKYRDQGLVVIGVHTPEFSFERDEANIREAIERVATRLGNTPTICRKCYVHPQVIDAYLADELKLELREEIDDDLQQPGLRPEERQVLEFLKTRLKA